MASVVSDGFAGIAWFLGLSLQSHLVWIRCVDLNGLERLLPFIMFTDQGRKALTRLSTRCAQWVQGLGKPEPDGSFRRCPQHRMCGFADEWFLHGQQAHESVQVASAPTDKTREHVPHQRRQHTVHWHLQQNRRLPAHADALKTSRRSPPKFPILHPSCAA